MDREFKVGDRVLAPCYEWSGDRHDLKWRKGTVAGSFPWWVGQGNQPMKLLKVRLDRHRWWHWLLPWRPPQTFFSRDTKPLTVLDRLADI